MAKLLEDRVLSIMQNGASRRAISSLVSAGIRNPVTRHALINAIEQATRRLSFTGPERPDKVLEDRYYMGRALLRSIEKGLDAGIFSKNCVKALSDILLGRYYIQGINHRRTFKDTYGFPPPGFVTISPTNVCNLRCIGCYAGEIYTRHTLPFALFDRVITDIKEQFGTSFFVISGGEPLAYRDGDATLFDILKRHPDAYFMAYTNGTLISKEAAERLAELGNFTPAISVEGFEKETDARRGTGVHKRILAAMDNLRQAGVPFGISATPTRSNADILLSDEFIDFYFEQQKALYGWYFQYMPIGRSPSLDLMVTPEQRVAMHRRIWSLVRERGLFIGDFWNSGTGSDGCMAAARGGGYFYIMWDGTITPCVFIPFKDPQYGNLHDLYAAGKTITDAIHSPLFSAIRRWQDSYWLKQPKHCCGNLLAPCAIRDHSRSFAAIVRETGAVPVDEGAREFLRFVEEGLLPAYNDTYRRLTDPVWQQEYLEAT